MPKARRDPYVQSTHSCPKNEWNEWLADNHCEAVILFLESSIRKNHYVQNTQKEQSFKIVLWRFIDVVIFLICIIGKLCFYR